MANVLIGGGTGMIGMRLSELLAAKGHQVSHLSRTRNMEARFPAFQWDINTKTIDEEAVKQADYIINLAGAGIADKLWSEKRKKIIIDSRVYSTLILKKAIEEHRPDLKAFLSASAIGFYGDRGEQVLTEKSEAGEEEQFLVRSVLEWEDSVEEVAKTGVRTALIRIGLVLSTKGGALPKILLSTNVNVGGYFGNGQQWYAWVHLDDLCQMFIHLIENDNLSGVFNGTAPNPERNKTFTQKVGDALDKNLLLIPAPAFGLKFAMGEMSTTVLNSARVLPKRIEESGFEFDYPELTMALRDLVENGK
ncbi:MAG: TIGR01777 family oxidoreductase [Bacteroidota bacterium]